MALSGVRSSWLIEARKRDLARLDSSARRRASSEWALAVSSSAIRPSFSDENDMNIHAASYMRPATKEKKGMPAMSIMASITCTGAARPEEEREDEIRKAKTGAEKAVTSAPRMA